MLVVKIDGVDGEAVQTCIAACFYIFGFAIDAAGGGIITVAHDAEFCREKRLLAFTAQSLTDQHFVVAVAVDVGGVERSDAEFERTMNGGDGFGVVAAAIKFAHTHATKADGGNLRAVLAQFSEVHIASTL